MSMLSIQSRCGLAHGLGVLLLGVGLALPGLAVADSASDHADKSASHENTKSGDKKDQDKGDTESNNAEDSRSGDQGDEKDKNSDNDKQKGSFSYERLIDRAKDLSKKSYEAPSKVPKFLTDMSADDWSKISFDRDDALWHDQKLPFQVMFYHPGSYYDHAVTIHVVKNGKTHTLKFDKNDFQYPDDDLKKKVPDDLGYAGLKLLHTLGDKHKMDEVMSFLGASYFRALGADEHYGLSARGLAIDTGNTDKGEEFPSFTQFWLVDPGDKSEHMTLYALLDSPSVTGAYKFVITPGQATHTHVDETLFTRKSIDKLGIAPLTSMFTWGENSLARIDNYRPEAHDSDGMLISSANGEWLWRPLVNPQKLWMNQFNANNVRGFGLIQRDRKFDDYQDLDYQYQKRPNAWITPDSDWGKGRLELVEIPSDSEVNDNITLYWIPEKPIKADQRLHYAYDIQWSSDLAVPESLGHAVATRVGKAAVKPGQKKDQVRVVIDFVGGKLSKLTDANSVQPKVTAERDVTLNNIQAVRNPHIDGWRLSFQVPTSALNKPLQLRAYLADANGGGLTETWSYRLDNP